MRVLCQEYTEIKEQHTITHWHVGDGNRRSSGLEAGGIWGSADRIPTAGKSGIASLLLNRLAARAGNRRTNQKPSGVRHLIGRWTWQQTLVTCERGLA